jgi:hypothetical protein
MSDFEQVDPREVFLRDRRRAWLLKAAAEGSAPTPLPWSELSTLNLR